MKHLFIVNPVAGGRDRSEEIRAAAEEIFVPGEEYEVYVTRASGDATYKVLADAAAGSELRVYAVGGDGTLNECVNGAALRENVAVTSYPGGTGNDFVRMFGSERERFFDLKALVRGEVRPLDLIKCGERYGVNVCSVGIDARIGTQVHRYSSLPLVGGSMAYVCSALVNFFRGINQKMRVSCGGEVWEGETAMVCACNGRYYGGGFNPAPDARPDDGLLDFILARDMSRIRFLRYIGKYSKGRCRELPEKFFICRQGREVEIESESEFTVNIDGEALRSRNVTFSVVPAGVKFVFPKKMSFFNIENEEIKAK